MHEIDELWVKMRKAKCQYCRHYSEPPPSSVWACNSLVWLSPNALKAQICRDFEWEDRLTKYDFEEDIEISSPSLNN